jgi:hypothetical protein
MVDLGCGKGRILFIASEFGFKEARGVEFAKELCIVARKNCALYQARTGHKTQLKIIESDVTNYEIKPDENVFFLGNPFKGVIISQVLDHIATSLANHPRKVSIIYYNPEEAYAIESRDDFKKVEEISYWGFNFVIYSNSK